MGVAAEELVATVTRRASRCVTREDVLEMRESLGTMSVRGGGSGGVL